VLVCVNAAREKLPNYYIFKGKRKSINYLCKTGEKEATMTKQPKAWMTQYLFKERMVYFLKNVRGIHPLSPNCKHLLILDGHTSHITLEVVKIAMLSGVDLLTFPSHTSHALQPLDVSCFKSFKVAFHAYCDDWTSNHVGQSPSKEDLAYWVSIALKRALTKENICKGFKSTGIYPLDIHAMDAKVSPNATFHREKDDGCNSTPEDGDHGSGLQTWQLQEINDGDTTTISQCNHYYVWNASDIDNGESSDEESEDNRPEEVVPDNVNEFFFELPWKYLM